MLRCTLLCLLAVAAAACAGSPESTPPTAAPITAAQIESAPRPVGVDPQLWARLTAKLAQEVAARGASALGQAPLGKGSVVRDLFVSDNGAGGHLTWTYRNQGDYDLNGEVNISDLTPIAAHFGALSTGADWQLHQFADGDGNGEVNISDVTPLGANFGAYLAGYRVQQKTQPQSEAEWADVAEVASVPGSPGSGAYHRFDYDYAAGAVGMMYRVVPVNTAGQPGVPGLPYTWLLSALSGWSQYGGDPSHSGTSASGPGEIVESWTIQVEGTFPFQSPVADRHEVVYAATTLSIVEDLGGYVYAVDRSGTLLWRYPLAHGSFMQPSVLADGSILIQDMSNQLTALYPDGKLRWTQQLTANGGYIFRPPLVDEDGAVYVCDGAPAMRRIDPANGDILWTCPLPNFRDSGAVRLNDTYVAVACQDDQVHLVDKATGFDLVQFALAGNGRQGLMVIEGTYLYSSLDTNFDIQGIPLGILNPWTYDALHESITAPVVIDTGLIAYGEQIPGPGPEDLPTGRIVCLNNTGTFQWDRPLPAATFCTLACDPGRGYLYYGTASQTGDAGMHCLDTTTQQELWSFPAENFCGGACIAGEGYIAFLHGGVSGVYLTGISQPK
jgi:outer membrane protein assembly factor BamB